MNDFHTVIGSRLKGTVWVTRIVAKSSNSTFKEFNLPFLECL